MPTPITMHSFTDCQAQARALAERIAERLRTALAELQQLGASRLAVVDEAGRHLGELRLADIVALGDGG